MSRPEMTWFWAKLGNNTWPERFHPVICHLIDVGQASNTLWKQCLREPVRRRVARQLGLEEDAASRWIAFWIAAHDIGKITPCFQIQGKTDELKQRLTSLGYETTTGNQHHTDTGTFVLSEALTAGVGGTAPLAKSLAGKLAVCVGGHHGLFPTGWLRVSAALGKGKWIEARNHVLAELARLFGVVGLPAPSVPDDADQSVWMVLAGLTSVADWIGSNESQFSKIGSREFVETTNFDVDGYFAKSGVQAETVLKQFGWLDRSESTGVPRSF